MMDNHTARAIHVTFSCVSVYVFLKGVNIYVIHTNKICGQNFVRSISFEVFELAVWKFVIIFSRWRVQY